MAWGVPVEGVVAVLTLVGSTTMALLGVIDGTDALTLYGVVLGYVFGFRHGSLANENRKPRRRA